MSTEYCQINPESNECETAHHVHTRDEIEQIIRKHVVVRWNIEDGRFEGIIEDVEPMIQEVVEYRVHTKMRELGLNE